MDIANEHFTASQQRGEPHPNRSRQFSGLDAALPRVHRRNKRTIKRQLSRTCLLEQLIYDNDTAGEPSVLTAQRLRCFAQGLDEVAGWAAHRPPIQPPHPKKNESRSDEQSKKRVRQQYRQPKRAKTTIEHEAISSGGPFTCGWLKPGQIPEASDSSCCLSCTAGLSIDQLDGITALLTREQFRGRF